jgi:hypothetical protein
MISKSLVLLVLILSRWRYPLLSVRDRVCDRGVMEVACRSRKAEECRFEFERIRWKLRNVTDSQMVGFEQVQMVELLPSAHWRTPVTVSCRITETRLWRETGRKHSDITVWDSWRYRKG